MAFKFLVTHYDKDTGFPKSLYSTSYLGPNKSPPNSGATNTFDRNSGWKPPLTSPQPPKPRRTPSQIFAGIWGEQHWYRGRNDVHRNVSYGLDVFDDELGRPPDGPGPDGPTEEEEDEDEEEEDDDDDDETSSLRRFKTHLATCSVSELGHLHSQACEQLDRDLEQNLNGPVAEYDDDDDDDGLGTEAFEAAGTSRRVETGVPKWYEQHRRWAFLEKCERRENLLSFWGVGCEEAGEEGG